MSEAEMMLMSPHPPQRAVGPVGGLPRRHRRAGPLTEGVLRVVDHVHVRTGLAAQTVHERRWGRYRRRSRCGPRRCTRRAVSRVRSRVPSEASSGSRSSYGVGQPAPARNAQITHRADLVPVSSVMA